MENNLRILRITESDLNDWLTLALLLWPNQSPEQMETELTNILRSHKEEGFLIKDDAGEAIAFINLSLRYDHVPGATKSPVTYIEGIYVKEAFRKQGIASRLIHRAEKWAHDHQCTELASDALIENIGSQNFHKAAGFKEVERAVTYIKQISN